MASADEEAELGLLYLAGRSVRCINLEMLPNVYRKSNIHLPSCLAICILSSAFPQEN